MRTLLQLAVSVVLLADGAAGQSISTVVGGGTDDGRPATLASFRFPHGLAIDSSGNIFVPDLHHRIRRIDGVTHVIGLFAGTGSEGFSGDGGSASVARVNAPWAIAVDREGNVFIADTDNCRIRRVDARTRIIETVAGNGGCGHSGDGGPATMASIRFPLGVMIDPSGNVIIADTHNHRIRRVDSATGRISTIAGTGSPGFSGDGGPATLAQIRNPHGMCVDRQGNLYFVDFENQRIRKVSVDGVISTVAGTGVRGFRGDNGPATQAEFHDPENIVSDAEDNLYISDSMNHRIRKISAASRTITTIAGRNGAGYSGEGELATLATLWRPIGLGFDQAGNLLIAEYWSNRVRLVDKTTGIIKTIAGNGAPIYVGDGGPATAAGLEGPAAVAFDPAGNLFVVDGGDHRVRRVSAATGSITTIAGTGKYGFTGDGGPATAARFWNPAGAAVDASGNLYISDNANHRVRKVDPATGKISTFAGTGHPRFDGDGAAASSSLRAPWGITVDPAGRVYVADSRNHRVRRIAADGSNITTIAGNGTAGFGGDDGQATAAMLNQPMDVAVFGSRLVIADHLNHRIREVNLETGKITTMVGRDGPGYSGDGGAAADARLNHPQGVSFDRVGNLFIADIANHVIRRVEVATTRISTIAGTGRPEFSGDGGAARLAGCDFPSGIELDAMNNVFITDLGGGRIRAIFACVSADAAPLDTPSDGSVGVANAPQLAWKSPAGSFRFDVLLDVVNPPRVTIAENIRSTTVQAANLRPLTKYYWQVVTKGDPFCVPTSAAASLVRSFTTRSDCTVVTE